MINSIINIKHIGEFICCIYVLLAPIFSIYGWEGFSFEKIISIIVVCFFLYKRFVLRQCFSILPKYLCLYFIWLIFCNYISFYKAIPFGNIFSFILFVACFSIIDLDNLYVWYKRIGIVFIIFFFIQEMSYEFTGSRIVGIFSWLPICLEGNDFDMDAFLEFQEYGSRSSAFFSEPAHFVQFLLPLLCIELYKINSVKSALFPFVIILVLLFLSSGNALLGLICIFSIYFISLLLSTSFKKKLILCVFILLVALGGVYYVRSDIGKNLIEREDTIHGEKDITSGFLRVYRGYYVYAEYNFLEKIIGINNIDVIKDKRDKSDVYWTFFDENDIYFNCIQSILLRTGIVGLLIFILLICSLWRHNSYEGKTILLIFIVLSFVASLYLSSIMILYLYISYNLKKRNISVE